MKARLTAVLALAFAALGLLTPVSYAASGSADIAFESISRCLAEREHLLVYALVDESASLQETDPDSARSAALEAMVRNLATLVARAEGAAPRVEIKMATFASEVGTVTDWTVVGPSSESSLLSAAAGYAERDGGLDTDFATALIGARDELDTRAAEVAGEGGSACRALLWFTDGDYDLEPRDRTVSYAPDLPLDEPGNAAAAMTAGRTLICKKGGLADDLHGAETVTLTIGLGSAIEDKNEALLKRISEGNGGCGSIPGPGNGAYLSAADLDGLLLAFDRASTGIGGGVLAQEDEVTPCKRRACPSGSTVFELDRSLDRFHLLVTAPNPLRVELSGPGRQPVELAADSATTAKTDGASLEWTHLGGAILLDGDLDASGEWVGKWTVTFIDPTGQAEDVLARSQVVLFGSLAPRLSLEESARQGENATLLIEVVDAEGTPRTPDELVATTDVQVRLRDPVTKKQIPIEIGPPDAQGIRRATFEPPSNSKASSLEAVAVLEVTTVGDVALPPRRDRLTIPLLPPASYPRVEPAVIDFGAIPGDETGTAEVQIVGGDNAGCVWFGAPAVRGSRDLGTITVAPEGAHSSKDSCLKVPAKGTVPVTVTASRMTSAGGQASGFVPISLTSAASDRVIEQEVPVNIEFVRVVDAARRVEWFALVFALGMLLPLLMLWLLNRAAAKYRDPAAVRYAAIPARVEGESLVRSGPDAAASPTFALRTEEFNNIEAPVGNLVEVQVAELSLSRHVPLWPLRRPQALALVSGSVTIGSQGHQTTREGVAGLVSFALPSQWVFAVETVSDGKIPVVSGRLWIFINQATPFPLIQDDVEVRLSREVPAAVAAAPLPPALPEPESEGWRPDQGDEAQPTGGWRPPSDDGGSTWTPGGEEPAYGDRQARVPAAPPTAAEPPAKSGWSAPLDDQQSHDKPPSPGGWRPPAD